MPVSLSSLWSLPSPSLYSVCLPSPVSPVSEGKFMPRGGGAGERRGPPRLSRPIPIPGGRISRQQTTGARARAECRKASLPSPPLPSFPLSLYLCFPAPCVPSTIHCPPPSLSLTLLYLGCRGVVEPMDPIGLGAWVVLPAMKLQKGSWDSSPRPSH